MADCGSLVSSFCSLPVDGVSLPPSSLPPKNFVLPRLGLNGQPVTLSVFGYGIKDASDMCFTVRNCLGRSLPLHGISQWLRFKKPMQLCLSRVNRLSCMSLCLQGCIPSDVGSRGIPEWRERSSLQGFPQDNGSVEEIMLRMK